MRTYSPKPGDIHREWHVIDATDVILGRLSVQTANLLRGKHKPIFAPHMDVGDFVVIVNAEKLSLSGDKATKKLSYRHSGFPGGLTATPVGEILEKIALTGDKATKKFSYRHSGFPGGLTATPVGEILEKDARKVVEKAVWGMLPKNKLGRQIIKKLKVYSGPHHPHQAQQAKPFEITQVSQ